MASKTKATQQKDKEEAPKGEAPETPDAPLPLLDLSARRAAGPRVVRRPRGITAP